MIKRNLIFRIINYWVNIYFILIFISTLQIIFVKNSFGANVSKTQKELDGKIIKEININIKDIFDDDGKLGFVYKTANRLKVSTKEYVVQQELFFKVGEKYNDFLVRESERELRSKKFLNKVEIHGVLNTDDTVTINVQVQETWTLIPEVSYSSSNGSKHQAIGVSESDIFGVGKRLEILNRKVDNRRTLETVWEDPRFMGTKTRILGAHFQRDDGDNTLFVFGQPYRTLADKQSWDVDGEVGNLIGRLYKNGDERYIYRLKSNNFNAAYSIAQGDPKQLVTRYSLGISQIDEQFKQASISDFDILNLNPKVVSNKLEELPDNRKFLGPTIGFQSIQPDYISMNYIDRFDRVEDYNLGNESLFSVFLAPETIGSTRNALLINGNRSFGYKFSNNSFSRIEGGISSRVEKNSADNSILRGEAKFFNVIGSYYINNIFLGKHTFASSLSFDYGNDLDNDREFLLGGDNGIRGYKAKGLSGDKRLVFNIEDRIHMAEDVFKIFSIGSAVFMDIGASTNDPFNRLFGNDVYSDVGVGLRVGFPRSSGGGILRFDIAFPLRDSDDGTKSFTPRIVIGAGQLFSSRVRSEIVGPDKSNVEIGFDR